MLVQLNLALCCSGLMDGQAADPYYIEAVSLFDQAAKRLATLEQKVSSSEWIRRTLLETYCSLAVCHWKVGRTTQAEQTFREQVQSLAAQVSEHAVDLKHRFNAGVLLLCAADSLESAKHSAALMIVRKVAVLADQCNGSPTRDQEFCESLAMYSLMISAFLSRLGDPAEALRQAEQARLLFAGLRRAVPAVPRYGQGLSNAWERIAKARWGLKQRDEALAAFRECAEMQRKVVEQAPSVRPFRLRLSHCYDRLAHWGGLHDDRATVAAALLEREKLWPNDAEELMKVSSDFLNLAEAVRKSREKLSSEEEAERQRVPVRERSSTAGGRCGASSPVTLK